MKSDYNDIKKTLDNLRDFQSGKLSLNEGEEEQSVKGAIPYSQQDAMLAQSLQPCKTQFGADFSRHKTPMLYYPEDGDIILSGTIPSLNNAKFQFRLLEPSGNGCFLWLDSIQLTKETIGKINKIYGVYLNWRESLTTMDDNKPLAYKQN